MITDLHSSLCSFSFVSRRSILILLIHLIFLFQISFSSQKYNHPIYEELETLRNQSKEMFLHGYMNYMTYAWPADEIQPLKCEGRWRPEGAPLSYGRGDVESALGRFQLTLIDSMDTLYIIGEKELWKSAIDKVIKTVRFDSNLLISVFETNIRILGGLLSNHLFCLEEGMEKEAQELLKLSVEIGDRLLPAFSTPTGLPYSKINLQTSSTEDQPEENCVACSGTFLLEFGLLSRLTGDSKYENAARKALISLKEASQNTRLMGSQINLNTGKWTLSTTGIGASVDSLYEYLIKSYIFFLDESLLDFFKDIYFKAMEHLAFDDAFIQANIHTGASTHTWTDSLSAFWPGMQVLVGDIQNAKSAFNRFWRIWMTHRVGLPERFDLATNRPILNHYHLRPELIESAYMLYSALEDPQYLVIGKELLNALNKYCRVDCGYAGLADIVTKRLDDTMDSFFLSETCKYLYLLFTPNHTLNTKNYIFTTEGHPFPMNQKWQLDAIRQNKAKLSSDVCLVQPTCNPTITHLYSLPNEWLNNQCSNTNSLYKKPLRKTLKIPYQLHFLLNGVKQSNVKHVGAHVLPSDREVIVTVNSFDSNISMYAIKAAFGGPITDASVEVDWMDPPDACTPANPNSNLRGKLLLATRGGCTFAQKALNIEAAGALAAVMVNNVDTAIFTMSDDKWNPSPVNIPLVLISKADGESISKAISASKEQNQTSPKMNLTYAHPHNENGVLQIVLTLNPGTPEEDIPALGYASGNTAFQYGDSIVLFSQDPSDQAYQEEWEGSQFQVFVSDPNAPLKLFRKRP